MANAFISITPQALIGADKVENVFYYAAEAGLETVLSSDQMIAFGGDWISTKLPAWIAPLPTAAVVQSVTVRGWSVSGTPSEELAVIIAAGGAGGKGGNRDGNIHTATLAFNMGTLQPLVSDTAPLRSSHMAVGPLVSTSVADNGDLVLSDWESGVAAAYIAMATTHITGLAAQDGLPIRVSHTANHLAVPAITAYREILGAFFRPKTGRTASRTNGR